MATARPYWARASNEHDLERQLVSKLNDAARAVGNVRELFQVWAKAYDGYHRAFGAEMSAAFVGRRGSQGQALTFSTGNSRSLASAMAALVTNTPTSLKVESANTEAKSQAMADIGTTVLEYEYVTGLEDASNQCVEAAAWAGEWWLCPSWDVMAGPVVARDEGGSAIRAGGTRYETVPPWRMLREPRAESIAASPWLAAMLKRNRYDMAALYAADRPEVADKILSTGGPGELWKPDGSTEILDDDWVFATYLYHRPTPALPDGLLAVLIGDALIKFDPAPKRCPFARMSAGELTGTPWGYSPWWETLAASDLYDDAWSGLLTSLRVLGKPMISLETDSDVNIDQLGDEGPMAVYRRVGSQPPTPMQWSQPPPTADKIVSGVLGMQRNAVGLNDFALGQPPTAELNAQAFALLISAATVQSTPFQRRRVQLIKSAAEIVLDLYRENAHSPAVVAVVGESSKGQFEKAIVFSPEDLAGDDVVKITIASGLAATDPGRVQMLQIYKAHGVAVGPEDITSVLTTGRLRQVLTRPQAESQLLAWEERELRAGRVPKPMFSDNILEHAESHFALVADPAVRNNAAALKAAEEHWAQHMEVLATTDPRILALAGNANLGMAPGAGPPGEAPVAGESAAPPPEPGFGGAPGIEVPAGTPPEFQTLPQGEVMQ